jgi:hypothetical protein
MKILTAGVDVFHEDGRADIHDEANGHFQQLLYDSF